VHLCLHTIYSTWEGFAAVKADGSITAWGGLGSAPDGNGYTKIYSNGMNFVAVKADGSLTLKNYYPLVNFRINRTKVL
jgi:hypothetical protein